MHTLRKRTSALIMSAVMAATSLSVLTAESLPVLAATSASSINKTLPTAINSDDPDKPANQQECTFQCAAKTDDYTEWTDTSGAGPATFLGTDSITTLQFNFEAEDVVTQFSYYFGCAADKSHNYWWDYKDPETDEAYKCTPYAKSFSVVIEIPSYANFKDTDGKFQIQNCYTEMINEETKKKTARADIKLVSIEANGTTDTSNGEKPDWIPAPPDPNLPKGEENTGGLNYSSANSEVKVGDFKENGDGTATITTLNSLKITDLDIDLTPGDACSEEYYATEAGGGYKSESAIRADGLPLNSHKFSYADFNFNPGVTVQPNAKVKSLSVTLKAADADANITRIMYGGGLNVNYKSKSDTEYAKLQAGLKDDKNAGYWYNDAGPEVLQQCTDAGVVWGNGVDDSFKVGGGTDLAKQDMGGYITLTWDVPAAVLADATAKITDLISFQLWYVEAGNDAYTDALTIVDASLTYEETMTFPYGKTASLSKAGTGKAGDSVDMEYSKFGMEYEKTADVYAVQFDVTLPNDANQVQVGAGTSLLEKRGVTDNWLQTDDIFVSESGNATHPILLYWEPTTAGKRPDAQDTKTPNAAYQDAKGTKTYTYLWIMPPTAASGTNKDLESGAIKPAENYVNAEEEESHLSFGVWYAGLGETTSDSYSIDNVTLYYMPDDKNNDAKGSKFEDPLEVVDSIDVMIGGTAPLAINVPGCTIRSSNSSWASATIDADGQNATVKGKNVTDEPVILTITTPGGQTAEVKVNVLAELTTEPPVTTTDAPTTTTKSTGTTPAVTEDVKANALYGDTNLDGLIDLTDAILLNKYIAHTVQFGAQQMENADCEYDGGVDSNDAIRLLRFLVHAEYSVGPDVPIK